MIEDGQFPRFSENMSKVDAAAKQRAIFKEELRAEFEEEMRAGMRPRIIDELRAEMAPTVKEELIIELALKITLQIAGETAVGQLRKALAGAIIWLRVTSGTCLMTMNVGASGSTSGTTTRASASACGSASMSGTKRAAIVKTPGPRSKKPKDLKSRAMADFFDKYKQYAFVQEIT